MPKETRVLKVGETIEVNGVQIKAVKCGMHKEGDQPARQTVTIEVETPAS